MSTANQAPASLEWVKKRAACSIQQVFAELKLGVKGDVEDMQSTLKPQEETRFNFAEAGKRFSVTRVDDPMSSIGQSVYFECSNKTIIVSGDGDFGEEKMFTAELTLTNEGHCKLKVGQDELYQWQFRRMALERLFFKA
jgi:hypothetical protein